MTWGGAIERGDTVLARAERAGMLVDDFRLGQGARLNERADSARYEVTAEAISEHGRARGVMTLVGGRCSCSPVLLTPPLRAGDARRTREHKRASGPRFPCRVTHLCPLENIARAVQLLA